MATVSISCHSCGAPHSTGRVTEFVCEYCETTNIVNSEFRGFIDRHETFFSGPARLVDPLVGLVHTLQRVRSFTTRDINKIRSDVHGFEREEAEAEKRVGAARDQLEAVSEQLRDHIRKVVLGAIALVVATVGVVALRSADVNWLVVGIIAGLLVIVTQGGALAVVLALLYYIAAALFGGISSALKVKSTSGRREAAEAAARELEQLEAAIRTRNAAASRQLVVSNRDLIRVIRNFRARRAEYEQIQDEIPIGVRVDHAVSMLNDLEFGKIIGDLMECLESIETIERRYGHTG
jgi:hypothetical protein